MESRSKRPKENPRAPEDRQRVPKKEDPRSPEHRRRAPEDRPRAPSEAHRRVRADPRAREAHPRAPEDRPRVRVDPRAQEHRRTPAATTMMMTMTAILVRAAAPKRSPRRLARQTPKIAVARSTGSSIATSLKPITPPLIVSMAGAAMSLLLLKRFLKVHRTSHSQSSIPLTLQFPSTYSMEIPSFLRWNRAFVSFFNSIMTFVLPTL